ncbi:hypothetical protein [Methylotenera sp.]|uniref:hypothetical protein n=1 Tax=Methylotenera sp. TaxID=2051956 RepID=UPI002487D1A7|nr:hypothetical protein [Methylotenera sp.]MDI1361762.1 hypothetical protein [Methylotenera sp.]
MKISQMNSVQHAHYQREFSTVLRCTSKTTIHNHKKLALAIAGILSFSPTANATLPQGLEVFNNMQEVSDSDLGHMRGKFASNNQVLYFGVEMLSQWQTSTGSIVTAGANLNIDFRGSSNGNPTVQYSPTVSIEQLTPGPAPVVANGNNTVSGGAGLANVSGVSQSIQVAGQSNDIHNGIDMQVDLSSTGQGGSLASAVQGQQAGTVSKTGADGTVATVTLANNSIGVNVTVPGQGQILQQIKNQGMFQSARIGGDLNQIHNAITMHIGLNVSANTGISSTFAALQSLKTMPQNSTF